MPERRDALISRLREIEKQIEDHEHPTNAQGELTTDLFCLNLTSWIGERAHFILEHIDALEEELAGKDDKYTCDCECDGCGETPARHCYGPFCDICFCPCDGCRETPARHCYGRFCDKAK